MKEPMPDRVRRVLKERDIEELLDHIGAPPAPSFRRKDLRTLLECVGKGDGPREAADAAGLPVGQAWDACRSIAELAAPLSA